MADTGILVRGNSFSNIMGDKPIHREITITEKGLVIGYNSGNGIEVFTLSLEALRNINKTAEDGTVTPGIHTSTLPIIFDGTGDLKITANGIILKNTINLTNDLQFIKAVSGNTITLTDLQTPETVIELNADIMGKISSTGFKTSDIPIEYDSGDFRITTEKLVIGGTDSLTRTLKFIKSISTNSMVFTDLADPENLTTLRLDKLSKISILGFKTSDIPINFDNSRLTVTTDSIALDTEGANLILDATVLSKIKSTGIKTSDIPIIFDADLPILSSPSTTQVTITNVNNLVTIVDEAEAILGTATADGSIVFSTEQNSGVRVYAYNTDIHKNRSKRISIQIP